MKTLRSLPANIQRSIDRIQSIPRRQIEFFGSDTFMFLLFALFIGVFTALILAN